MPSGLSLWRPAARVPKGFCSPLGPVDRRPVTLVAEDLRRIRMIGIARPRLVQLTAGCSCALAALVSAAHAQQIKLIEQAQPSVFIRVDRPKADDPEAPARLAKLIEELQSPDFKTRCRADRTLNEDTGISLSQIELAIKQHGDDLTLDTRERLCSAARGRFNQTPRAAMGIQFWMNSNLRDRVVIERTFPKFDSNTKLEDGDMVVEADGVKIGGPTARTRFQSVIVSHDPGDVIPLVVRRGEQKLDTEVKLGRRDELENNPGVTPDILDRAWRVRADSILRPEQAAIRPPVVPQDWSDRQTTAQIRVERLAARRKGPTPGGPTLVGGGMPRGADQLNDQLDPRQYAGAFRRNGQVIIINNMVFAPGIGVVGGFDPMAEANYPPMKPQEELAELTRARGQHAMGEAKAGLVRRPGADGRGGVVIMQNMPGRELQIIDKQIAAIRAELAESGQKFPDSAEAATPPPP